MSPLSKKYAAPLHVEINPSPVVISILLFVHASALVALWLAPASLLVQLSLSPIIIFSAWRNLRLYGTRAATKSIRWFVWDADDQWQLHFTDGSECSAIATQDVFIFSALVIINLKQVNSRKRFPLILTPDMLDENNYRQLRVRLKLNRVSSDS